MRVFSRFVALCCAASLGVNIFLISKLWNQYGRVRGNALHRIESGSSGAEGSRTTGEVGASPIAKISLSPGDKSIGDLRNLARRLLDAGLPPYAVTAAIRAIVVNDFSDKVADLIWNRKDPYWRRLGHHLTAAEAKLYRDIQNEEQETVKAVMGDAPLAETPEQARERALEWGSLSPEKIAAIKELRSQYNAALNDPDNAGMSRDDRRRFMAQKQNELDAAIDRLLTPGEALDYRSRQSEAAQLLVSKLDGIDVSQEQYLKLFEATYGVQKQYLYRPDTPAANQASVTAHDQMLLEYSNILSPDQFYQYLNKTNSSFAKIADLSSLGPIDRNSQLAAWQAITQLHLQIEIAGKPPYNDAVQSQLSANLADTQARVRGLIGDQGLQQMMSDQSFRWLRAASINITPTGASQ